MDGQRHLVRVVNLRRHAAAQRDAAIAGELGPNHRRIGGPDLQRAGQRLDDRAALHLVIVLADDPVLAGDVRMRERGQKLFASPGAVSSGERR